MQIEEQQRNIFSTVRITSLNWQFIKKKIMSLFAQRTAPNMIRFDSRPSSYSESGQFAEHLSPEFHFQTSAFWQLESLTVVHRLLNFWWRIER